MAPHPANRAYDLHEGPDRAQYTCHAEDFDGPQHVSFSGWLESGSEGELFFKSCVRHLCNHWSEIATWLAERHRTGLGWARPTSEHPLKVEIQWVAYYGASKAGDKKGWCYDLHFTQRSYITGLDHVPRFKKFEFLEVCAW